MAVRQRYTNRQRCWPAALEFGDHLFRSNHRAATPELREVSSMTHLWFRLSLVLTGLFTAALLVIRVQPYDDHDLRAFLTPPYGCPTPCWMGIRPGTTPVSDGA